MNEEQKEKLLAGLRGLAASSGGGGSVVNRLLDYHAGQVVENETLAIVGLSFTQIALVGDRLVKASLPMNERLHLFMMLVGASITATMALAERGAGITPVEMDEYITRYTLGAFEAMGVPFTPREEAASN